MGWPCPGDETARWPSSNTMRSPTGAGPRAILAEAAARGHRVTALSRSAPEAPTSDVAYVQSDAVDEAVLTSVIEGSDVVVGALAPRGPLAEEYRDVHRTIARLADSAGVPLYVVGGCSTLRPAPGADRFITGSATRSPSRPRTAARSRPRTTPSGSST
jgi:putative NADH-flavin reductase